MHPLPGLYEGPAYGCADVRFPAANRPSDTKPSVLLVMNILLCFFPDPFLPATGNLKGLKRLPADTPRQSRILKSPPALPPLLTLTFHEYRIAVSVEPDLLGIPPVSAQRAVNPIQRIQVSLRLVIQICLGLQTLPEFILLSQLTGKGMIRIQFIRRLFIPFPLR